MAVHYYIPFKLYISYASSSWGPTSACSSWDAFRNNEMDRIEYPNSKWDYRCSIKSKHTLPYAWHQPPSNRRILARNRKIVNICFFLLKCYVMMFKNISVPVILLFLFLRNCTLLLFFYLMDDVLFFKITFCIKCVLFYIELWMFRIINVLIRFAY